MQLSKLERLTLINQYQILEKLNPEESEFYARHRKALEEGYVLHYEWIFNNLHEEMFEEQCREVQDILEMYRAISFAYMKEHDVKEVKKEKYQFQGFDGNNEPEQRSYASYVVHDLGRYGELKYHGEYTEFNSHSPMLEQYRTMLKHWKSHGKNMTLTIEQADELLAVY